METDLSAFVAPLAPTETRAIPHIGLPSRGASPIAEPAAAPTRTLEQLLTAMLDDPNPTAWEVAGLRTVDSPDLHTNSGPETPLLEFIAGSPLSLQSTPSPHEPGPLMLTPMADDGQYARWHITGALSFMGMLELERAIATQPGVSAAHIRPRDNGAEIAVDCRDIARTLQTLLELPSFTITLAQD